jgi:hypothetical protein
MLYLQKPGLYPLGAMLYAIDMVRSTGDIPNGTPHDISRLTVPEAAQALGISPEAVRNRLSRGTLESEKKKGKVYVLLKTDTSRSTDDTPEDTPRHTRDRSTDITGDATSLISAKDETIRLLTEQLEAERAASAELRRIVAGLVQRVPELEPAKDSSSEPPESPVVSFEETHKGTASSEQQDPSQRRSWWRAFFGLE